ncbi:MAG: chromate transporter [Clostridia bacterium]|nr:chromate transporter [Clostridia bacterium]
MLRILRDLFLVFAKIGLFTFGGGYAMISVIENNCVEKKKWITHDEMMDVTVMAESTPGPIAINMATYVGFKQAGMAGAVSATVGIVLPSFLIILLLSGIADALPAYPLVQNLFRGIRTAVPILILDAGFNMVRKMKKKPLPCAIVVCAMIAMFLINFFSVRFSSVALMAVCGAVSLCAFPITKKKGAGK